MRILAVLLVFIGFSLQSFDAVTAISRRPANIVGPDGRAMVRTIGFNFMTPEEVRQVRNSVGYFYCPGNPAEKIKKGEVAPDNYLGPKLATGFLVSKDVVVTVAHALYNFSGTARPSLGSCYFQTQGDTPGKKYFIRPETIRTGFRWQNKELNDDYAVVRLKDPIENAQPLVVLNPPAELRTDTVLYPVVASRPNGTQYGDLPHEPLIQECKVTKLFQGSATRPTKYFNTCDNEMVGSGGPNLTRVAGQLVVTGIFYASGPSELNGREYSETPIVVNGVSGLSLTKSAHIDSVFLRDVEDTIRAAKAAATSTSVIGASVPGAKSVSRP